MTSHDDKLSPLVKEMDMKVTREAVETLAKEMNKEGPGDDQRASREPRPP